MFSGKFEPVTRSCRHPLDNGSLCPRKDRVKCPFHGVIVDRDTDGNVVAKSVFDPESDPQPWKCRQFDGLALINCLFFN